MKKDSTLPTVVIAMNAFREGGSQTYAFTLARMLKDYGIRPVLIAKPGPWFSEARESADAIRVIWREGTSLDSSGPLKRVLLRAMETLSAIRLSRLIMGSALVISSQPGPTAFFSSKSQKYWPGIPRVALVHGTTPVEWPFYDHQNTVEGLTRLLAATPETSAFLRQSVSGLTVDEIGNLFRANLYWGSDLDTVIQKYDSSGPVIFLGTLTPNKVGPISALFDAISTLDRKLVVVGGGPNESALRSIVTDNGWGNDITFAGAVSDPRPWIQKSSLVVTAGRGAIESMAGGRPTLVATSDGVHGIARLDNLTELANFNFTGRTPSSQYPASESMVQHLQEGLSMQRHERLDIARLMNSVGSLDAIVSAVHGA
ncbi:glycosyltransferase [Pseudarthrobacter psychrotolerans]|uniref:Glycosyltransferase n=1 Tax=Pseudarthrobacter psychrotolerans TaxID=2697569 RepID=A0A6P1NM98_9MICC|nr:glycosyltransferase [Pseudarthrobacter psychrotolerans]QHK20163.1 glycosyltransferase [Pseudarthrobacter psychrotolerans]